MITIHIKRYEENPFGIPEEQQFIAGLSEIPDDPVLLFEILESINYRVKEYNKKTRSEND